MNKKPHGITFGEVVSFIEEIDINATDTILVFQLLDLIKLYDAHLKDLRITLETRTHSKRFRTRLLSQFVDLSTTTITVGINYDDDGYILAKASNILRGYV